MPLPGDVVLQRIWLLQCIWVLQPSAGIASARAGAMRCTDPHGPRCSCHRATRLWDAGWLGT